MDDKGNDGENLGDTGKDDKDMGDRGNEGKGMDDKDNDFIDMDPKGMDGTCTDDNDEDACKDGIDMDDVHLKGKGIDNKGMAGSDLNEYMEYLEIVNKTFRTQEETYMLYVKSQIVEGTNWQVANRVVCDALDVFGVLRKVPYDKVPYGRDARELQGKDGKDSDVKVPTDLEGKDGEDLHAKNLDVEHPNDLEGKDGVDLDAKNLDTKNSNDLEGKDSEELDAKKLDAQVMDANSEDVVDVAIQIMRHDEPVDTRDGQLVYIERVVGVAKLERDGRIEKCYEDALADIPGTTQGTSYLKHDMVFLPTRSLNVRWFLVVVNPRRKEIRVLDSLFYCMVPREVRGMEAHLRVAMRINGIESNAWEQINVTQWLVRNIIVPKGDESALYMLKNIELFTGEKLRMQYDQAYIDKLRRELHVVLVDSPYNKMKYRKRFKQYHARLSDAAAVEDDEEMQGVIPAVWFILTCGVYTWP
ncbi:hypothetical protein D1007_55552 [Hordeum vulgare]|nr:hypothetical protein D1007_55552 [Hordeum vulgare]